MTPNIPLNTLHDILRNRLWTRALVYNSAFFSLQIRFGVVTAKFCRSHAGELPICDDGKVIHGNRLSRKKTVPDASEEKKRPSIRTSQTLPPHFIRGTTDQSIWHRKSIHKLCVNLLFFSSWFTNYFTQGQTRIGLSNALRLLAGSRWWHVMTMLVALLIIWITF